MKYYQPLCHKIAEMPDETVEFYIQMFITEAKDMIAMLEGELTDE